MSVSIAVIGVAVSVQDSAVCLKRRFNCDMEAEIALKTYLFLLRRRLFGSVCYSPESGQAIW